MSKSEHKKKSNFVRLTGIASTVLFIDQVTKFLIQKYVVFGTSYFEPDRITIIDNFLYIVHIGNEGAAWGLFAEYKHILTLLAFFVLGFIYVFREQLELYDYKIQIAFGLLIGGILGNLTDRLFVGYVIDFIDVHLPIQIPGIIPDGRWPAFNVADSAIVIGMIAYLYIYTFHTHRYALNSK